MAKGIKLTDLISVDILQKIQDGFSKYTGMAALITDVDGIPITRGSNFTDFCMGHMRKSKVACSKCNECDSRGAFMTLEKKQATVYSCHAGLTDFAVPILIEGQVIGSFIGGQVRTDEVDVEKMRFKAIEYDIDPDSCVRAAKATNMLSKEEIQKAADFLQELGDSISGMAYMLIVALGIHCIARRLDFRHGVHALQGPAGKPPHGKSGKVTDRLRAQHVGELGAQFGKPFQ